MPLVDRFDAAAALRVSVMAEEPPTRPTHLEGDFGKVSSPELASLAAVIVGQSEDEILATADMDRAGFARIVRSLAASVLSQAEGTPRK